MYYVAQLLVYAVFALGVTVCIGTVTMASILRKRFPEVWASWGQPAAWGWLARTPASRSFFEFLDRRAYLATHDRTFIAYCSALRAGWYSFFGLFVVAFIVLVAALVWQHGA
ncbi:hypothetical protein LJR084_007266 [Variovorax sp. LjRoot84]|uniref:hypothetical protein n=1 Tax=Variovorax sp. LjRoot84 TaxID=3342340 RepID=UPI003ED0F28F